MTATRSAAIKIIAIFLFGLRFFISLGLSGSKWEI